MELEKIDGITKKISKKLKKAGFNWNNITSVTKEGLFELEISEQTADKILKAVEEITKEPAENEKVESKKDDFDLKKENKYLVAGFKSSKHYDEKLKDNKLKEAFEKFKKE